jgi:hypothetical protein
MFQFLRFRTALVRPVLALLFTLPPACAGRHPVQVQTSSGTTLSVTPDGSFLITTENPSWSFGGTVGVPLNQIVSSLGKDGAGSFQKLSFQYTLNGVATAASVRAYHTRPIVVFSTTLLSTATNGPLFPRIQTYPPGLFKFGFNFIYGHQYGPWGEGPDSPWAYFDSSGNTFIVSPASHFPIAANVQDSENAIVAGINTAIPSLPSGFTQETMLVVGTGINNTWNLWGYAMTDLQGKVRPASDSDISLIALGYWTDSATKYYYNYIASMGYEGTLVAVKQNFTQHGIPIGSMQLDSWWYPKGNPPAWNNMGDTVDKGQYLLRPDATILPDGLGGLQQKLGGTPLLVHSRWIDPTSPLRQQYIMSGNVSTDPQYWKDLASYLHSNGVMTYEQDWLASFAQPNLNLTDPEAYLDNMAQAMAAAGITMQYCGQSVGQLMQASKYNNLTTSRVSQDGFNSTRWDPFLYGSRLASSLGVFPFADNVYSTDVMSLVLETHSAGLMAIGDAMGSEVASNLLQAIRNDGVIVKPDAPIVPMDSTYLADAQAQLQNGPPPPMLASSYSNRGGASIAYVFGYSRAANGGPQNISFSAADLGLPGAMYVYNYFSQAGQLVAANSNFFDSVSTAGSYYVVGSVGASGIAFFGDTGKFVSAGRQRIGPIQDSGILNTSIQFTEGETSTSIQGYSPTPPVVTANQGSVGPVTYDPVRQIFTVVVTPSSNQTASISISKS